MSYPFKGFKSSGPIYRRRDITLGCGYYDTLHLGAWGGGEVPWSSHAWGAGYLAPIQLPRTTL
jgi:hypothetical protein